MTDDLEGRSAPDAYGVTRWFRRVFRVRPSENFHVVARKMAEELLRQAEKQLPGEWRAHLHDRAPRGVDYQEPNWMVGNCAEMGRQDANGDWWIREPWIGWRKMDRAPYLGSPRRGPEA